MQEIAAQEAAMKDHEEKMRKEIEEKNKQIAEE